MLCPVGRLCQILHVREVSHEFCTHFPLIATKHHQWVSESDVKMVKQKHVSLFNRMMFIPFLSDRAHQSIIDNVTPLAELCNSINEWRPEKMTAFSPSSKPMWCGHSVQLFGSSAVADVKCEFWSNLTGCGKQLFGFWATKLIVILHFTWDRKLGKVVWLNSLTMTMIKFKKHILLHLTCFQDWWQMPTQKGLKRNLWFLLWLPLCWCLSRLLETHHVKTINWWTAILPNVWLQNCAGVKRLCWWMNFCWSITKCWCVWHTVSCVGIYDTFFLMSKHCESSRKKSFDRVQLNMKWSATHDSCLNISIAKNHNACCTVWGTWHAWICLLVWCTCFALSQKWQKLEFQPFTICLLPSGWNINQWMNQWNSGDLWHCFCVLLCFSEHQHFHECLNTFWPIKWPTNTQGAIRCMKITLSNLTKTTPRPTPLAMGISLIGWPFQFIFHLCWQICELGNCTSDVVLTWINELALDCSQRNFSSISVVGACVDFDHCWWQHLSFKVVLICAGKFVTVWHFICASHVCEPHLVDLLWAIWSWFALWQTELTFHCNRIGVINPLSTTASNQ